MSTRLHILSCLVGNYDSLSSGYHDWGVPSICYTDRPDLKQPNWDFRPLPFYSPTPKRSSLFVKTHLLDLSDPDVEFVMWIDARVSLAVSPLEFLQDCLEQDSYGDIWAFRHPERSTVSEELEEIRRLGLSDPIDLARALKSCEATASLSSVLYETGVLLVRKCPESRSVLDHWWRMIEDGADRDQVSFPASVSHAGARLNEVSVKSTSSELNIRKDFRFTVGKHIGGRQARTEPLEYSSAEWARRLTLPYRFDKSPHRITVPAHRETAQEIPLAVVVPVHNAHDAVRRCFSALSDSVTADDRIIIVDDGSEQPTRLLCEDFASSRKNVVLLRNSKGSGFTLAANQGIKESGLTQPVLLLNSDTVIVRAALDRLRSSLSASERLGAVGPVSNRAMVQSIFSHEDAAAVETLESLWGVNSGQFEGVSFINDVLERMAREVPLQFYVPTLNGFCILLSDRALREVGLLDSSAFPRGFGEEVDWCFRATDLGFLLQLDCGAFVYHQKSASYKTDEIKSLKRDAAQFIRDTYGVPRYGRAALSVRDHPLLSSLRQLFASEISGQLRV